MQQPVEEQRNANFPQIERNEIVNCESPVSRRTRIYVELCGSSEDISGFLDLCADQQVKLIVHRRPPLRQYQHENAS